MLNKKLYILITYMVLAPAPLAPAVALPAPIPSEPALLAASICDSAYTTCMCLWSK